MIFDSFNYLLFVMTAWFGFFFVPKKIRRPSLLFFSLAFSYIIDVKYFAAVLTCLFFDISTFWAISKLSNVFFRVLFLLPNLIIFIYFQLDLPFPNLSEFQSAFHTNEIKILVPWGIAIFLIQKLAFLIRKHKNYNLLDYLVFQNLFFKTFSGPIDRYEDEVSQYQASNFSLQEIFIGIGYIFWGLFLKVAIANKVAPLTYVSYSYLVEVSSPLDFFIYCMSIGLFLMITCYSFFQIGYGTGLIFGIKIYRNYDTPFLLNSINDFWRRWNLTYFNFSGRGTSTFFSNRYVQYCICILLNTIIWFGYLNIVIFFSLMMFLTFIDLIFSKFVENKIITKSIFLRYLYKVPSLIMIVFVFGISFFMNNSDKSVLVNYEGFSSVGIRTSQLAFLILSTLIFIVFNYLKKRKVLEKIKSHVSPQIYFLGMFFGVVYLIMFGSF